MVKLDLKHAGENFPGENSLFFGRSYQIIEERNFKSLIPGYCVFEMGFGKRRLGEIKFDGEEIWKGYYPGDFYIEPSNEEDFVFDYENEGVAYSKLVDPRVAENPLLDVYCISNIPDRGLLFLEWVEDFYLITNDNFFEEVISLYHSMINRKECALNHEKIIEENLKTLDLEKKLARSDVELGSSMWPILQKKKKKLGKNMLNAKT